MGVLRDDEYDRTRILLEWVGRKKRVLEVGCSTGYISRLLAERECCVTGVEIDHAAAKRARYYCREIHVMDVNSTNWASKLPPRAFDVVLLADVLEHLVDPAQTLWEIAKVLNTNGRLVISLPNVAHWITRGGVLFGHFNYQPAGTLDHTHLRFFTVRTARELIESSGYRVVRFHPAIGGRMSGHVRPVWQGLARVMPGLFAYQLLFEAKEQRNE